MDEAGVRTKKVDMPQTITELYDVAARELHERLLLGEYGGVRSWTPSSSKSGLRRFHSEW